ncbi:MAG TPA: hypothetical protein ENH85_08695 [Candidatus Scalindua sp.]|nr:hypothetical protein [Candidatus Scalindua sp.]
MYYCYILLSLKSHIFYFGSAKNLRTRLKFHNEGKVKIFGDRRADLSKLNIVQTINIVFK